MTCKLVRELNKGDNIIYSFSLLEATLQPHIRHLFFVQEHKVPEIEKRESPHDSIEVKEGHHNICGGPLV